MTKIAKCYAKFFTFKKNLRFKQNVRFKSVRFDSKKVCATEVTHTEKCNFDLLPHKFSALIRRCENRSMHFYRNKNTTSH